MMPSESEVNIKCLQHLRIVEEEITSHRDPAVVAIVDLDSRGEVVDALNRMTDATGEHM